MIAAKNRFLILGLLVQAALACAAPAFAATTSHEAMAPLDRYLMPKAAEIALARSAAPAAISAAAEVMVLGRRGYSTAVKGRNGFLCIVERSWAVASTDPAYWDPAVRGPICFNTVAARSFLPIYLMKTRLLLAGKSRATVLQTIDSALDRKELPALAPGAMCYMMSKGQEIGDPVSHWHPHLMFFVADGTVANWGADLPGSPVMSAPDPEERATILMVLVNHWSDGTKP